MPHDNDMKTGNLREKGRKHMKHSSTFFILVLLFTLCCCGGGGGGNGQPIPPSIAVSFTAAKAIPDAMDVSLQKKSQSGDSFTMDVVITGVNNVFSASFDIVYNSTILDYINYTEGTFLSENGQVATSFLVSDQTGRLVVGATRLGQVPGVNAAGNEILMSIAFKAKKAGSSSVSFENNNLLDPTPAPIQGLEWFGGTATAN